MGWGYTPDDKVYEKLPWVHTRVIPGGRLVLLLLARGDHAGAVVVRQAAARHREGELAGGGALHTRARCEIPLKLNRITEDLHFQWPLLSLIITRSLGTRLKALSVLRGLLGVLLRPEGAGEAGPGRCDVSQVVGERLLPHDVVLPYEKFPHLI